MKGWLMDNTVNLKQGLKRFIWCIGIGMWILLTAIAIYAALNAKTLNISSGGTVIVSFVIGPFLLLGALYGYLFTMVSFSLSFILTIIFDMHASYNMAINLVAAVSFSLFSQYYFFTTKKKTFLAALVTLVVTGIAELACLTIIPSSEYNLESLIKLLNYLGRDVITVFGIAFAIYLFFNKAPDICKLPFPIGIGYTAGFRKNTEVQRRLRKTRVSAKITAIIFALELALGISVSVFTMVLFPDLRQMMVGRMDEAMNGAPAQEQQIEPVNDSQNAEETNGEAAGQQFLERLNDIDYKFNESAVRFDIKMILLMLCVGVPMAAFANYYTKVTIGGPLGVMSDFMYEYANADDERKLDVGRKVDSINVKTRDEIQILNDSMKATVHAVEDYIGRIHEKQEVEKELEIAQRSSEAKSSFLSNMSHEIRTPINAVLGMNEMILRECEDEQILEYAANVKSAGNSLLGIVNDILDFSKIEAGKMDILPVQYHIGSTINDLVNLVAAKISDKGLELEINVDETLPVQLIGDEIRIKQCVTNILTNAVKYTEKGTVTLNIGYRKADNKNIMLRFQVVDTGIGIKEEDLDKLFSPFERIEEIRNRTIEGTGLGMSIVKKLLALMDTKLEVKSVYGEGSDFSFEIRQQVVSWEPIGDFKKRYKEYLQSTEKYHESFTAPDAEILVVDDTVMNLTVIKGLLKRTRVIVDTAESGKEALEKVVKKRYDAIFIDHRMPEMDGLETLAAMKELKDNMSEGVPCIALTANALSGARQEYIAAGFDDYLAKPVNGKDLEKMLMHFLPDDKLQAGESADEERAENSLLTQLQGIDLQEALKNSGNSAILENVVQQFLISIDSKADAIEGYAREKDFRNYTVFVHALKSSARLIGALELSEMAASLEECGNNEDDVAIQERTPQLLDLYRSYKDKLAAAGGGQDEDLPEIPVEELISAFGDMKELIDAYDFDTADSIMEMLSQYSIPQEYKEKYGRVKELISAVDRDALLEIL